MNSRESGSVSTVVCVCAASFFVASILFFGTSTAAAQQAAPAMSGAAPSAVPSLISYNGVLGNSGSQSRAAVTGVTFLLYRDEQGGAPLWIETQNVTPDKTGHYVAQLGATSTNGLPPDLFRNGEPRWLAVQVAGEAEQPRVLLVAVPYAMKAADAATLGGLPPSAFVLAAPPVAMGSADSTPAQTTADTAPPPTSVSGSGTTDYLPLWTSSSALGNSVLFQSGTGSTAKLGINTATPAVTLDVKGATNVRGILLLPTTNSATATTGYNSNPLKFTASSYNSATAKAVTEGFQWQAEPSGNNTSTPSATLNLLFGAGVPPTETGLTISSNGVFTFASGQTFPGSGTVTSVGVSAPSSDFTVSGSPITTSGTLALNWAVAPTNAATANAIVKRDANGSFSAGPIGATNTVTGGTAFTANDASNGSGGYAIQGLSNSGTGVLGSGVPYGVFGSGFSVGVYGTGNTGVSANGYTGLNAYGSNTGTFSEGASYGVYASGNYGVYGSGGAYGVYGTGGTGVYGTGPTGVTGVGLYTTPVGVYAQAGDGGWAVDAYNTASGTGVLAGSDTGYAGWFNGVTDVDGNLDVAGTLTADTKKFRIDHPLDPANKYLEHASVESSELLDIYTGNVTTDARGEATVRLPQWFEALNTDFRYQLTVIGQFAQAIISRKIENHQFQIRSNAPSVEVSWQVTGVRNDAYARAHPLQPEIEKPEAERGFYRHPELYGAPAEKSVAWAQQPKAMKQWKEARAKAAAQGGTAPKP